MIYEKRIVLVRHGKPAAVSTARISGRAIGEWVRQYNAAGITTALAPPTAVQDLALSARCIVASDLRRARESAAWLAGSREVRIEPELREAALPESLDLSMRLSPGAWVALARIAWWFNWRDADETVATTRQRAARVADRLEALAAEHGTVMAIGHGIFNRFIATHLRRRGWHGPKVLPRVHWAAAPFDRARARV